MIPKYLFFDLQGVLDGIFSFTTPASDDLIIEKVSENVYRLLPKGMQCIKRLHQLIDHHHYQVVFQSRNSLSQQLHLLQQLQTAAHSQGLQFPIVVATAVSDALYHPYLNSNTPNITHHDNGMLIGKYGVILPNKKCTRIALATMLHITEKDRYHHFVFDDSEDVVKEAIAEGYRAFLIGSTPPALSLIDALNAVV